MITFKVKIRRLHDISSCSFQENTIKKHRSQCYWNIMLTQVQLFMISITSKPATIKQAIADSGFLYKPIKTIGAQQWKFCGPSSWRAACQCVWHWTGWCTSNHLPQWRLELTCENSTKESLGLNFNETLPDGNKQSDQIEPTNPNAIKD